MVQDSPKTPLLVFAVGGRIGSGCSYVQDGLRHALVSFGYEVEVIDVTKTFLEDAETYLGAPSEEESSEDGDEESSASLGEKAARVRQLQKNGNRFRRALGDDAIAALCVSEVILPHLEKTDMLSTGKRQAFIIDSVKHPAEVQFLRKVFRESFFMVGVVASDKVRQERLIQRKGYNSDTFAVIDAIDANEKGVRFGQKSIDAVVEADYFFANDFARLEDIQTEALRLMRLVFGVEVQSPRRDEIGMHMAFEASRRSACLSRQVGAAVFDRDGEILATGCNDVPKFGGGLYVAESERDQRCYSRGGKCYNDEEKRLIAESLVDGMIDSGILAKDANRDEVVDSIISSSRVRDLIEFTRAVHAETDAIIAIARSGKRGLPGATLYCTTFPCHNCAKHIIDAGIIRVVYLQPYEKSLARKLHSDAISAPDPEPQENHVAFALYGGVAPFRFDSFFTARSDRKDQDGQFVSLDRIRTGLLPLGAQESAIVSRRIQYVVDQLKPKIERAPEEEAATAPAIVDPQSSA